MKMKKLLSAAILMATPAYAQDDGFFYMYTSHLCDYPAYIVKFIETEYKEKLLFTGIGSAAYQDETSYNQKTAGMMFFVNQETSTWSLVYLFSEDYACIMETGTMFEPN